jgi:hypothetical protein
MSKIFKQLLILILNKNNFEILINKLYKNMKF